MSNYSQRYNATTQTTTAGSFYFDTFGGTDYSVSKAAFGAAGAITLVDSSNPLPVTVISCASHAVTNAGTFAVQAAQSGTWNITNVSGTISLPTGAATAAKQPALGTAGTASSDVITIQGVASMTPVQIADNGGSLTVDGTVAATQSGTWTVTGTGGTFPVTDSGGSLTVDAPVGTPVFVRLSDGSSAISTLPVSLASVPSHAVTNAGTFVVQENGAALTALQLIDDVVRNAVDTSNKFLSLGAYDEDNTTWREFRCNASGGLQVVITGTPTIDSINNPVTIGNSVTPGTGQTNLGKAEDAAHVTGATGVMSLAVRQDTAASLSDTDGDYTPLIVDSSGRLHTVASQAGTWNVGTVTTVTTCSTVSTLTGSSVAHDSPDAQSPHKIGARAVNADITAVANNDRTDLVATLTGKLITHPWSNPENFISGAITSAMTGTTSTSLISAPGSGLRNYITQITVSNSHATVGTDVIIQDGSGGTTLYTIPAAAVYGGAVINFPVPLRQPTANTALYCANVTTGASTKVSASGFKGA